MAEWLELATDDQVVTGSNPTEAAWKRLPISSPPLCQCLSEETKSRWSFLSGVYARGSKRSHVGGKCVTFGGFHILPGQ